MSAFTVRISDDTTEKLDSLAKSQDRSRSYLAAKAIEEFIEKETWQIAEIQAGLEDADRGEFASEDELSAIIAKYAGA